jgi:two-component system chemotaxis response regulator CheY
VKPKKVLVIDDSRLIHKMFGVLMGTCSLVHALDGVEALQRLAEQPDVDLILLDINMPRMDGLEFLGRIKQDHALSGIPVVIVSTEGKDEDTVRGLEAGAAAYVKKPFQGDELLNIIARLT